MCTKFIDKTTELTIMKQLISISVLLVLFSNSAFSQVATVKWGAEGKASMKSSQEKYFWGPEGNIFALERDPTLLGYNNISIVRFNQDLTPELRNELVIEATEATSQHFLIGLYTCNGEIVLFSYKLLSRGKKLELYYSVVDPVTLTFSKKMQLVHTVDGVEFPQVNSLAPPFKFSRSANNSYLMGIVPLDDEQHTEAFIIGPDKELVWRSEISKKIRLPLSDLYNGFYVSESGIAVIDLFDERAKKPFRVLGHQIKVIDTETGEEREEELGDEETYTLYFSESADGMLIAARIQETEETDGNLVLFIPELHQKPLIISMTEAQLDKFRDQKKRKRTYWGDYLQMLSYEKADNGSIALIFEHSSTGTYFTKNEIVTIAVDPVDGEIQWITKIRRSQSASSLTWLSAITHYQNGAVHIFYNDGTRNLNLPEDKKPKVFRSENIGDPIIVHMSITDDGTLHQGILERLPPRSYWLDIIDSGPTLGNKILLKKSLLLKQRLGIMTVE